MNMRMILTRHEAFITPFYLQKCPSCPFENSNSLICIPGSPQHQRRNYLQPRRRRCYYFHIENHDNSHIDTFSSSSVSLSPIPSNRPSSTSACIPTISTAVSTSDSTSDSTSITQHALPSSTSSSSTPPSSSQQSRSHSRPKQTQRRSRRKNPEDIQRERKNRAKRPEQRTAIIAFCNGVVLAESEHYEFLDGRFFFPPPSVKWNLLEKSDKYKHFNPVGRVQLYDVVFHSDKKNKKSKSHSHNSANESVDSKVVLRIRGAVMSFVDLRDEWKTMEGYTCFWKGVKLIHRHPAFLETSAPGMRPPSLPTPQLRIDNDDTADKEIDENV